MRKIREMDRARDLTARLAPRIRRRADAMVVVGAFLSLFMQVTPPAVELGGYALVIGGILLSLKSQDVALWFATA